MNKILKILRTILFCNLFLSISATTTLNFYYQNLSIDIQEDGSFCPIIDVLTLN